MKNILCIVMLMLCLWNDKLYAQNVIYNYGYGPAPVVVNVPTVQTTWIPVSTVVQHPVVYYPVYVWGNWPIINYQQVDQPKRSCWWHGNTRLGYNIITIRGVGF